MLLGTAELAGADDPDLEFLELVGLTGACRYGTC
jgi:hypothetical protein